MLTSFFKESLSITETKKNDEIEILRGIAILFTLVHHFVFYLVPNPRGSENVLNLYSHFTFWSGVDLFFCISGYVIMNSFTDSIELNSAQSNLKITLSFWLRRIIRLMPSAVVWMCIYLFLTYFYNSAGAFGEFGQNIKDMCAAFFQYFNYYGLSCWGPFKTADCGPNGVYWSLSLEEQFYFLFPILFFVFKKYFKYLIVILFFIQFFMARPEWSAGWAFRFDSIILGVLISLLLGKLKGNFYELDQFFKYRLVNLFLIGTLVFFMAYIPAGQNGIPYNVGFLSAVCGIFVLFAALELKIVDFHFKIINKLMVWLGSRSYTLYLAHVIVFRLSYEILYQISDVGYRISNDSIWILSIISVLFLIIFTELSYIFIEMPTKVLAKKYSKIL